MEEMEEWRIMEDPDLDKHFHKSVIYQSLL